MSDAGDICQMPYTDFLQYFAESAPPPPKSSPCFGLWEIAAGDFKAYQCAIANNATLEARQMAANTYEAAWKAYRACHGTGVVTTPYTIHVTPSPGSVSCGHVQTFQAKLYQGAAIVAPQPVFKFNASAGITCNPLSGASTTVSAVPSFTGNASLKVSTPTGLSVIVPIAVITNPPTLVAGPTASPNPVPGKQTYCQVVASDACGGGLLSYAWSAAGPAAVQFVPSGGVAAASTVATFTHAGTYQFEVQVSNTSGYAATGYVLVLVEQTATTLQISPGTDVVGTGSSTPFVVQELDQFGNMMPPVAAIGWSITGPTNSVAPPAGVSTVATAGLVIGTFTITATSGNLTAIATLIVDVEPAITNVVPDDFSFCRATNDVVKIIGNNFTLNCDVLLTRPDLSQISLPNQTSLAGGSEIDLSMTSLDMVGVWGATVTNSDTVTSAKFTFYSGLRIEWDPYGFGFRGGIVQNTNPLTQIALIQENDGQQPALAPFVVDNVTITPYAFAQIDKPTVAPFNGQITLQSVLSTSTGQLLTPNVVLSQGTSRSFQIKSDGVVAITGTIFQPDGGKCGCYLTQPNNYFFTTDTIVATPVPGGTLKTVNVLLNISAGCWTLSSDCDLNAGTEAANVSLKYSILS